MLVLECAAHLLVQTGKAKDLAVALKTAEDCLDSGKPAKKFDEMLTAQEADIEAFNDKLASPALASVVVEMKSERAGYVSNCDARIIGEVVRDLGGGRLTKESRIDHNVGIDRIVKPGEPIEQAQAFCRVHAADEAQAKRALARLESAFEISAKPPEKIPLIIDVISN